MPEAVEPVADVGFSEQTSIEPVQRFNLIVAAMLLAPPGIISQWFVTMIASAISPAPTTIVMFRPISPNMRREPTVFQSGRPPDSSVGDDGICLQIDCREFEPAHAQCVSHLEHCDRTC